MKGFVDEDETALVKSSVICRVLDISCWLSTACTSAVLIAPPGTQAQMKGEELDFAFVRGQFVP